MIEARTLEGLNGVRHAFFTRQGGVSEGLYSTLNCGIGTKDAPERVAENRARVLDRLGVEPGRLATPYQVHSAHVVVAEAPWERPNAPKADGVVTAARGLAVGVLAADCAPVLLCDASGGLVAAAHAGWRGALAGVVEATVAAMERLGARRSAIAAAIGPAISQGAYEVGEELRAAFLKADPANARYFKQLGPRSTWHFDLPGYVAGRLRAAGLDRIEALEACTYGDAARFFSYRRATHRREPDYGRQISAIVLL